MYPLLFLGIAGAVLCFLLTPLVRNLSRHFGFVDLPDNARKVHTWPIPRVGGIAIALSYLATFGFVIVFSPHIGLETDWHLLLVWKVLPAAMVVFLTGLIDDLRGLKPWQKLLGQLAGALIAYSSGVRVAAVGGHYMSAWVGFAVTIVWLIGCSNAFNLIDGMDGLASGVGLFATLTTLIVALLDGNTELAVATAPLAGCLLGFLRFNFNPASIFLGDCGSLMVGFLLGCFGVIWSQKAATMLAVTAPLMTLAIPLLDTGLAIVRRFLRHQPLFAPDRDHIHHRLLSRGLKTRDVALLLYAVCGIAATLSLVLSVTHEHYSGVVVVLFCGAAWVGIQHLGYAEFDVARRMVLSGTLRRVLTAQICVRTFEDQLAQAESIDDCWHALRSTSKDFGFNRVYLCIKGQEYEHHFGNAPPESCWTLRVPLSNSDCVEFTREFHCSVQPMLTTHFVDVAHTRLQTKLRELEHNLRQASTPTQPHVRAMSSSASIAP